MLGVAFSAMALLYLRDARSTQTDRVEFSIAPVGLSRYTGTAPEFAISPDGRHVAFAATTQGVSTLWVRSLATLEQRSIPGTEGARSPFWSPDSASLGFFAGSQLKTVRVTGGSPAVVCEAPFGDVMAPSGTWNRSDEIVFGRARAPLQRVGLQGGTPAPVTTLAKDDIGHRWPSFLPDGQHFLYLAQGLNGGDLRIGSLVSAETVRLGPFESHGVYAAGHLFFVRGGTLVAQPFDADARQPKGAPVPLGVQTAIDPPWQRGMFSVSATGRLAYSRTARTPSELMWVDRHGKVLGRAGDPGVFFNLDLSPDERQVAVSQMIQIGGRSQVDIWLIELAPAGRARRLTDDPPDDFDPAWSRNGKQVAFNSNPHRLGGFFSLFVRPSHGSDERQLLVQSDDALLTAPDWSPDDRFVVYTRMLMSWTDSDLWTVPLAGDRKPTIFLATPHIEAGGTFSPDGRWIAYESNVSGRNEIYVRPFPKQPGQFPVSRDGGWAPRWRRDGKELFFLSLDGTLMAAGIDTTRGFAPALPEHLFPTELRPGSFHPYAVTRDGQRFLIPREIPPAPITVVLNWPTLLAK